MPPRAIKHQLTCPFELTSGSFLIGRRRILVIPRNHLVLFDITLTRAHVSDKPEAAFKLLQIQNIRQALSSRLSWSPLKEIVTDEIFGFQSSNLFDVMNKSRITYSYSEDEKHHNDAKSKLNGE